MQERTLTSMFSLSYVLMCTLVFAVGISYGIVNPIFPIFVKMFGAPYWLIGMTVSTFFVTRMVCEIPAGAFYDRIGWRIPILIGMVIQTIAATLVFVANDIYVLLLVRAVHAIGSTMFFLTVYSFAASSSPHESRGRFVGTLQGVEWIGSTLGGISAGLVAGRFGARTVFLVAGSALALGTVAAVWLWHAHRKKIDLVNLEAAAKIPRRTLLKMPAVYVASAAIFFFMFEHLGVMNTVLPIYVNVELSFSLIFLSLLVTCISVGQIAATLVGGPLADRIGYGRILAVAMAVSATSSLLLGQLRMPEQLVIFSAVFGATLGIGSTLPVALIGSEVKSEHVGSAMGIYRTFMDLGGIAGPLVVAATAGKYGYGIGFAVAGLAAVIPCGLLVKLRKPSILIEKRAP